MNSKSSNVAILVGGGPAPGINSVIAAATIRAVQRGATVIGIRNGFERIMQGDVTDVQPLVPATVHGLHFRGGSYLGASRANPTRDPKHLQAALDAFTRLGVSGLITIGGDDTAYSAAQLAAAAAGRLRVVHVPKTIDNDLDLPHGIPTFGFQTARHVGVEIVKNLIVDAHTTARWYFVVTMGRKAGHLALGIGRAAGAALTLIPEALTGAPVRLAQIADILVGAIITRRARGRLDGVAVLAEGLAEQLDPEELARLGAVERDAHGHLRLAELDLGNVLKRTVSAELERAGLKLTIVSKEIGYELRCADPIAFDMEYSRDLGYCAAQYLLDGGSGAMVSIVGGRFVPMPFSTMRDPATGRTRVRTVDVACESYQIARRYMDCLDADALADAETLAACATLVKTTPEALRARFQPVAAAFA